jgi:hypothetical protein
MELADGRRCFLALATDAETARWLRTEIRVSRELAPPPPPRLLGAVDESDSVALILEDFGGERWPPPWGEAGVGAVRDALAELAAVRPVRGLPRLDAMRRDVSGSWAVQIDPVPFLRPKLCTPAWLMANLETLVSAERNAILEGDSLLHLDVRSDNICLTASGVRLVDWNWASAGRSKVDAAFWAPSLHAEGGPAPENLLGHEPELAALVCGFFAANAGLPAGDRAARVREIQKSQLRVAFPWAVRSLALPPPQ